MDTAKNAKLFYVSKNREQNKWSKNQTDIKYTYKKENKNVWKINFKKHFFWLSGVLDTAKLSLAAFWTPLSPNFVVDYLSEYESVSEKNYTFYQGL